MRKSRTGLTARLRSWMRAQQGPFYFKALAREFGNPHGIERQKLWKYLDILVKRGEVERYPEGQYRYNKDWRRPVMGKVLPRILKAMYIVGEWSANEIMFFAGTQNRNHIHRVIARLVARGYVRQRGRQRPYGGKGLERVYGVVDKERFRREVL